ncbi:MULTISPECIES: HD domain-containing protein [unclassified Pseudomonas]|uniref:HD domain-containing protein n=1 Tax=unclassified Pseudomonas TaxID=196821 RepID=UPI00209725CC|nr:MULTISPECIES: HD domain-containing protein [unclassified Pseudomonas]MCO7518406.1 HD domain-containing protein [Pseudomonas sp. 1]MCO7538854.1 HD domain-containing protein [Pseudomonas sp. VA159-2]
MTTEAFAPFQHLAADLFKHLPTDQEDGSHDLSHIHRVWVNAQRIQRVEGGDLEVLLAATVLHDCVAVEKNSPLRGQASTLSAQKASSILAERGWPLPRIEQVAHAIKTHSYSAGFEPLTLEARILQDSDRLDAIGAVGIARCFYVSGRMGAALYDFQNPSAQGRDYQDARYTLEHFHTKLLRLASGFTTGEGARLAAERHARLEVFVADFMDEIAGQG